MPNTDYASRIARFFGYVRASDAGTERAETRTGFFAVNRALYDGTIYSTRSNGGFAEDVLQNYVGAGYGDPQKFPIYPFFLPFREIVDTYLNVFPGGWGQTLRPADTFRGKPFNSKLADPLWDIWSGSGLDTAKQKFVRWSANFGTVGIRIRADEREGTRPARASIAVDEPWHLFSFEEDNRRNVTAVVLKYDKLINRGTRTDPDWETVKVVEEITRNNFSLKYDGVERLDKDKQKNLLGFCPYVIHRFKDNGTDWGDWAYKGSETRVHRINWRISRQDRSIDRHQFPKWFGAGAGDKPSTVEMGDTKMSWVKLHPDSPAPVLQAVVADIDQGAAQKFWMAQRDEIRGSQPELNLNDVQLLGNTSGEALAQILKPTEQAILSVRPGFDHALVRAMQMAVSAGIVVGAWDVGTGTGSDAADRAYREGFEDFELTDRPALPETPQQKLVRAQAAVAERKEKFSLANAAKAFVNDPQELLLLAGYDEDEASRLAAVQSPAAPAPAGSAPSAPSPSANGKMQALLDKLK